MYIYYKGCRGYVNTHNLSHLMSITLHGRVGGFKLNDEKYERPNIFKCSQFKIYADHLKDENAATQRPVIYNCSFAK